jgi:anti-sigma factor (TIGR02949 family)
MGSPEVGGCDCDEVRRHLWPYLDRETDPPTCAELEAHLEECSHCRRMAEFDQSFKRLVRRCADGGRDAPHAGGGRDPDPAAPLHLSARPVAPASLEPLLMRAGV